MRLAATLMKLTVSMITMNEEGAIAKVVRDIRAVAPDAEILVVDSSKDRTPEIAAELGCRVLRQFPPRGYGPAMDRALREASGDIVITLDCDDTYPTDAIPRLPGRHRSRGGSGRRQPRLAQAAGHAARRTSSPTARSASWRGSSAGRHRRWTCTPGCAPTASRCSRPCSGTRRAPRFRCELVLLPQRLGYRVVELPIDYRERIGKTTLHKWNSTLWTFKRIWKGRRSAGASRQAGGPA